MRVITLSIRCWRTREVRATSEHVTVTRRVSFEGVHSGNPASCREVDLNPSTSGSSNLKSWVGALSRFGDSHGFYWATVAIAKTAHSKAKL